jgi:hypothetical protein
MVFREIEGPLLKELGGWSLSIQVIYLRLMVVSVFYVGREGFSGVKL